MGFHELVVADVERLCDDAAAVRFAVPTELREAFTFDAGQSLTLRRFVEGREERRSYSICAPVGEPPRIGVREIPGGLFSHWLVHDVRPGDRIEVQEPGGRFRADPSVPGRHLCIAAGSGITPMLSVAASVLANPASTVSLVYANRSTGTVMFADELADLKDRYTSRFDLVHVMSREPRDVELFSGRLDADRLRRVLDALALVEGVDHVWLCGPYPMVTASRDVLLDLGVPADRVHVELFHVDEPPPEVHRSIPVVEGATTEVSVTLDGRTTTTTVAQTTTVLDGVAATRHDLPFACKGGVCGTCRALVTRGEVDQRRNYALDDDELARGFVLTCQSYPCGDDVAVDFDA